MLIRAYLNREPPEELDDFMAALTEVELIREERAKDFARGIALAFGEE